MNLVDPTVHGSDTWNGNLRSYCHLTRGVAQCASHCGAADAGSIDVDIELIAVTDICQVRPGIYCGCPRYGACLKNNRAIIQGTPNKIIASAGCCQIPWSVGGSAYVVIKDRIGA